MKTRNKGPKKVPHERRYISLIVIALNVILLTGTFLLFAQYITLYQKSLNEENLGNIANLNRSAATNAASLIDSWNNKLQDIEQYAEQHEMTEKEALEFISDANSNSARYFELIGSDYTGHLARKNEDGSYPELTYANSSYSSLQTAFNDAEDNAGEICFAPEFTDNGETAEKFFAIYKHLTLKGEDSSPEVFTLLLAAKSDEVLEVFNNKQTSYDSLSSVLIDPEGNYIVSNSDFKSANFFQYLYVYNDLTLDDKNAIRNEMIQNGSGEFYYKNAGAVVEDCVFRYEKTDTNDWYCITCAPISSFRIPAAKNEFVIYAVMILVTLLAVDVIWMQSVNRRLRISMRREQDASAAKGNFMSRMSHEIRTPLNAVIGYNTIARGEMSGDKSPEENRQSEMRVMDCLTKSDIASRHLLSIINDVLDMSAIESGKIKVSLDRFDFRGLITSLTTIFYSQAKQKNVNFEVVFGHLTDEWFIGDQMRINQILTNLLSNAIKFTSDGGLVRLAIRQKRMDDDSAKLEFEISDTGIGMSEEYLEHIWTPFEQADSTISRRFGGTGLGLSITKNLVDLMGGNISVKSKLSEGSTFTVELTVKRTSQPDADSVYDFSGINALVVDDDPGTCDYIKLLFDRCGAKCIAVTSGEQAIEIIKNSDNINLCLVDWRMPGMDGIDTIKAIRSIVGNTALITVLTAYDFTDLAARASEMGVNSFISKPLFQSSLFDLLAGICGKHSKKNIKINTRYDFNGKRVILAEDNTMNMEIAKKLMESTGMAIDCAWNGREAVDLFLKSEPGYYMAILMDIHMPEMNGHEATKAIRASSHPEAASIPIIAMTADAFAENVAEALACGMTDHISKPIDTAILFEKLNKHLN